MRVTTKMLDWVKQDLATVESARVKLDKHKAELNERWDKYWDTIGYCSDCKSHITTVVICHPNSSEISVVECSHCMATWSVKETSVKEAD